MVRALAGDSTMTSRRLTEPSPFVVLVRATALLCRFFRSGAASVVSRGPSVGRSAVGRVADQLAQPGEPALSDDPVRRPVGARPDEHSGGPHGGERRTDRRPGGLVV